MEVGETWSPFVICGVHVVTRVFIQNHVFGLCITKFYKSTGLAVWYIRKPS